MHFFDAIRWHRRTRFAAADVRRIASFRRGARDARCLLISNTCHCHHTTILQPKPSKARNQFNCACRRRDNWAARRCGERPPINWWIAMLHDVVGRRVPLARACRADVARLAAWCSMLCALCGNGCFFGVALHKMSF